MALTRRRSSPPLPLLAATGLPITDQGSRQHGSRHQGGRRPAGHRPPVPPASAPSTSRPATAPSSRPTSSNRPSSGTHPAIVFVNSWGLNDAEYLAQATAFARAGYTVLSYTTRGFWGSGGQIDTAGPQDIADVSAVIDWLLAHTTADPAHIGVAGVSYGAGIGLIASACRADASARWPPCPAGPTWSSRCTAATPAGRRPRSCSPPSPG